MAATQHEIDVFAYADPPDPKALSIYDTRPFQRNILRGTWLGIIGFFGGLIGLFHFVDQRQAERQRRERRELLARQSGKPAPKAETRISRAPREEPAISNGLPDWISSLRPQQEESQPAEPEPASEEPVLSTDVPDWLSSLPSQENAAPPSEEQAALEASLFSAELPDWLSALPEQQETSQPAESPELPGEAITPGELPDWISQLGAAQTPPATHFAPSASATDRDRAAAGRPSDSTTAQCTCPGIAASRAK